MRVGQIQRSQRDADDSAIRVLAVVAKSVNSEAVLAELVPTAVFAGIVFLFQKKNCSQRRKKL